MELKEILKFIEADDQTIQHEQMVGLLTKIEENTKPAEVGPENDVQIPLELDLNKLYTDYECWRDDGSPGGVDANGFTINPVDIDYWYALEYGIWVKADAGLIVQLGNHRFDRLLIKTEETTDDRLRIVISGRRRT